MSHGEDEDDDALVAAARAAAARAWAPYSGIRVGAALRVADGRVFAGCNVENASYGLTLCAERTALVRAVAEGALGEAAAAGRGGHLVGARGAGPGALVALAIAGSPERPMMPCGACRQVLAEFAGDLRVVIEGAGGERLVRRLADLLPEAYTPSEPADGGAGAAAPERS